MLKLDVWKLCLKLKLHVAYLIVMFETWFISLQLMIWLCKYSIVYRLYELCSLEIYYDVKVMYRDVCKTKPLEMSEVLYGKKFHR